MKPKLSTNKKQKEKEVKVEYIGSTVYTTSFNFDPPTTVNITGKEVYNIEDTY